MSHSRSWPARDFFVPFSRFPAGQRHRPSLHEKESGRETPYEGSVPCLRSNPKIERAYADCQGPCVTAHPPPSFRRRPESRNPHHPQPPRNQPPSSFLTPPSSLSIYPPRLFSPAGHRPIHPHSAGVAPPRAHRSELPARRRRFAVLLIAPSRPPSRPPSPRRCARPPRSPR